ncbi:MAG TPA: phenylalanine--tRNA ligase beta subunit-related protein [Symbiobacteriaceae bacterium]|nr:phenylalanine--tRNA ligase beta subunit-related protein [Symbiobacteriaceae bacterium]
MSKFIVAPELFELFPELCFGVVVAEGIDNAAAAPAITELLQTRTLALAERLSGTDVREHPHIAVWRQAFQKLGLNPNKYPSSIEALAKRVAKGAGLPSINPVVDLGNAMSVTHLLPMGAHDMDVLPGDIEVRLGRPDDIFIPFGAAEPEGVDPGEVVYATGNQIRTRKWVWRQGEKAKVVAETRRIFIPIDAFDGVTGQAALAARSELAGAIERFFGVAPRVYWVDRNTPSVEITA